MVASGLEAISDMAGPDYDTVCGAIDPSIGFFLTEGRIIGRTPPFARGSSVKNWMLSRRVYRDYGSREKRSMDSALRIGQPGAGPGQAVAVGGGDQPSAGRERPKPQEPKRRVPGIIEKAALAWLDCDQIGRA